ncbi:MAG: sodium:solute symporter family protein [Pelosinus sp.]|nr:sodium:solute symporter family protein [Pelosinus sp.]
MEINFEHLAGLVITIIIVIGGGIYSARSVKSAEGYSLGGRSSGPALIAGSIAGTAIGGGATVGTAQLAYSLGLSAWWFTLGSGIALILMGLFYARPLRRTGLETIPQYLVLNYGPNAGPLASVISSIGIFISAVASCLPGIQIIAAIFNLQSWGAAIVLIVLIAAYVFFGGMKSAGVSGIMKMLIIWVTLVIAGVSALLALQEMPNLSAVFPPFPWFSLFGHGIWAGLGNLGSLIIGIVCTQTYIQAVFSASDSRTAAAGAFVAALIIIPVGLPSIAIGMYMHAMQPDILPILVLPIYLLKYQPAWLGGVGLAGILLSIIGSIAGLALGIGTMVSRDICSELLHIKRSKTILQINRITTLLVMLLASFVAIINLNSQVLTWNYMSMALRGAGIFLPLTLAIFAPGKLSKGCAVLSMALSTAASIAGVTVFHLPIDPLYIGILVSAAIIMLGLVMKCKETGSLSPRG